jgi:tetratricopeptide (TPR) repeat protein
MSFDVNWESSIIINHAEEFFIKANSLFIIKNYNEAIENYDKAIETDPNYIKAYIQKGILLTELKRTKEAIECYDKAIEIDPTSSEAYASKAAMLETLKKFDDAIIWYNKAIEVDPNNPDLFVSKGLALDNLNRFEEAIECYDIAIELDPNYPDVYNNKGVDLKELKRYDDAMTCFTRALELDPNYSDAFVNAGNVLFGLKVYEAALTCYDKAIGIEPNFVSAYTSKGITLNLLKRLGEAIEVFDKVLEMMPNYPEAYNNKSLSLYELGKFESALNCLNTSIEINPKNSKAYHYKGLVLFRLKKLEEAIKSLKKAIELNPNNPIVLLSKAVYLKNLDLYEDALTLILNTKNLIAQDVPFSYNNPDEKNLVEIKQLIDHILEITNSFKVIFTKIKLIEKTNLGDEFRKLKQDNNNLEVEFVTKYTLEQEMPEDILKNLMIQIDKSKNLQQKVFKLENNETKDLQKNLLQKSSEESIEYNIKGLVAAAGRKYKDAIDFFNKAIEINPDYEEAIYNKGIVLIRSGAFDKAITCFNLITELNAKNFKAYQNKSIAMFKQLDLDQAFVVLEQALKYSPKNPLLFINKAVLLKESNKYNDSLILIRKARDANIDDFAMYDLSEESIKYIERVVEVIFDLTYEINEMENLIANKEDPTGSLSQFVKDFQRIKMENRDVEFDFIYKCCIEVDFTKEFSVILQSQMEEVKKLKGRVEDLLGQLQVKEEKDELYNQGIRLFEEKEFDDAIDCFKKAIKIDSSFQDAFCSKAICEVCLSKFETALGSLSKAEEISNNYDMVYYLKSVAKCKRNKIEEAYKEVNKAFRINEENLMVCLLKAVLMKILNNDLEDSLVINKKCLNIDSNDKYILSRSAIQSIIDLTNDMKKINDLIVNTNNKELKNDFTSLQTEVLNSELEIIIKTALNEKTEDFRKLSSKFKENLKNILQRALTSTHETEPIEPIQDEVISHAANTTTNEVVFKHNPLGSAIALFEEEKYEEAINYFDKVLESDRNNVLLYHYKSISLYHLQKYSDAIYCLSQTSSFINPILMLNKAIIRKAEYNFGEAIRILDNTIDFDDSEFTPYELQTKDIDYISKTLSTLVETTHIFEMLYLKLKNVGLKNYKNMIFEFNNLFEQNMRTDIRFLTNITINKTFSENFNRVYLVQQDEVRKLLEQQVHDTITENEAGNNLEDAINSSAKPDETNPLKESTQTGKNKIRVDRRNLKKELRENSKLRINLNNITNEISSINLSPDDLRKMLKQDLSKNSILKDESRLKNQSREEKKMVKFGAVNINTNQNNINTYNYNANEEIIKNTNLSNDFGNDEDELDDINKIIIMEQTSFEEKKIDNINNINNIGSNNVSAVDVSNRTFGRDIDDFEQNLKKDFNNNLSSNLMKAIIDYYYGLVATFNSAMVAAVNIISGALSISETFYDFEKLAKICAFVSIQGDIDVEGIRNFGQLIRKLDIKERAERFSKLFQNKVDKVIGRIAYLLIGDIKDYIEKIKIGDIRVNTKLETLQDKYHDITEFNDPKILKQVFKNEYYKLGIEDAETCIDILLDNNDEEKIDEECVKLIRDIFKKRINSMGHKGNQKAAVNVENSNTPTPNPNNRQRGAKKKTTCGDCGGKSCLII